ncbi:MAG: hypothetical protein KJ070_10870 [Verrucomicrobia bacterium]|nr:hypothetical protein [Verrucomicrobiota bacterium]
MIPTVIQLFDADGDVAVQCGKLALLEQVGFNPPPEQFVLFVRGKLDRRCFDFFPERSCSEIITMKGSGYSFSALSPPPSTAAR